MIIDLKYSHKFLSLPRNNTCRRRELNTGPSDCRSGAISSSISLMLGIKSCLIINISYSVFKKNIICLIWYMLYISNASFKPRRISITRPVRIKKVNLLHLLSNLVPSPFLNFSQKLRFQWPTAFMYWDSCVPHH